MTGAGFAPVIVTALFGDEDHAYFDGLRQKHFPPERNQLAAHLTMFHHLPPTVLPELRNRLALIVRGGAPAAEISGLIDLGRGVAFRIRAPGLDEIRADLAAAFHGMLTPQDDNSWRAHVTIQNKVGPAEAKLLLAQLQETFRPRPVKLAGLAAWYYRGGPWEQIARYPFRA